MFSSIIVTYNPDFDHVYDMCLELILAGVSVVVVDNTPCAPTKEFFMKKLEGVVGLDYHSMGKNVGLAKAFNYGINTLRGLAVEGVLFFDQDSSINSKLVSELISEYNYLNIFPRLKYKILIQKR